MLAYLAGTTALGLRLGRAQHTARDYFVADRGLPWWAILISVVATETSAITFISIPALAYLGDFTFLQIAAGYIIGRIIVSVTLLPRYYHGELVTAYALLERRFGIATRRFASSVFLVTRALADSVRLFATAIPVALILSGALPAASVTPVAIVVLGALTTAYTYYGGVRAVVWTDVLQTGVYLLGGAAAAVVLDRLVPGGWHAILAHAAAAGKLRVIDPALNLHTPYTLAAGLIGGAFLSMASHGADQLIVQRLLAARGLRDSQRALVGSGIVVLLQFAFFLALGTGLYAFFGGRTFTTPDAIFPGFILQQMPPGLIGVIVAAILAATMSTHSGAINSLAAATTHDIVLPLLAHRLDDAAVLRLARRLSLVWGLVLTAGALLYREQGTPVVAVALSIASFTYGGLLGGFFLGMWWRRARQRDAILGMAAAIAVMSVVVFARSFATLLPDLAPILAPVGRIAWPWYVCIGTAITLLVGMLSSLTHGAAVPGTLERA